MHTFESAGGNCSIAAWTLFWIARRSEPFVARHRRGRRIRIDERRVLVRVGLTVAQDDWDPARYRALHRAGVRSLAKRHDHQCVRAPGDRPLQLGKLLRRIALAVVVEK